nr:arylesterase [uncultured Brevundimonas sp.]
MTSLKTITRQISRFALLVTVLAVSWAASARASEDAFRLLAFGDSLVHGLGLPAEDSFPVRLEGVLRAAGWQVRVINGGNSGDTSAAGLARLGWALADAPQAVILELGANDMLRGLDPDAAEQNLDAILARLKAEEIPVLLVGMRAAPNWGADYVARFDAIYPRLAERHGVPLYPFFLEGVAMDPALNQEDGLHPNSDGVAAIVEQILPRVEMLLADAGARKGPAND